MITAETLDLHRRMRIMIDRSVDAADREIVLAWTRAWREVAGEWSAAISDLVDAAEDGWPSRAKIDRAARARKALALTVGELEGLSRIVGVSVSGRLADLVSETDELSRGMVLSQLPAVAVGIAWDRINEQAIRAIVKRTTQQVESLTRPLSREAAANMKAELIRGVTVGSNPKRAASRMLQRTKGRFDGGLARARTIARTEMIDAHREAAAQQHKANRMVAGWVWLAALDHRTCGACVVMHGSEHKASEPGPLGHQNCRCARLPQTKPWADLGIRMPESSSLRVETGEEWFAHQPREVKVAILGRDRLSRLELGTIPWEGLVSQSANPGWRDSVKLRRL